MNKSVLDASAIIAVIRRETGHEAVLKYLPEGVISAVSISEVLSCARKAGADIKMVQSFLDRLGLGCLPFDGNQAAIASSVLDENSMSELKFADRACMALAIDRSLPVVTGNADWLSVDVGLEVINFRSDAALELAKSTEQDD